MCMYVFKINVKRVTSINERSIGRLKLNNYFKPKLNDCSLLLEI